MVCYGWVRPITLSIGVRVSLAVTINTLFGPLCHEPQYKKLTYFHFRSLDPESTGFIEELTFRKIMKSKEGISDNDVNEMIAGEVFTYVLNDTDHLKLSLFSEYRKIQSSPADLTPGSQASIQYKGEVLVYLWYGLYIQEKKNNHIYSDCNIRPWLS